MTVPKLNRIPNSFEELASTPDFKLSTQNNVVITNLILVGNKINYTAEILPDFY